MKHSTMFISLLQAFKSFVTLKVGLSQERCLPHTAARRGQHGLPHKHVRRGHGDDFDFVAPAAYGRV
jgi:hypothetical protein